MRDEVAIFAQTLMAGAILDQAKVLCPLLENELLRQVWWTGMKASLSSSPVDPTSSPRMVY